MDGKNKEVKAVMSKKNISVLTIIAIIFTVGGIISGIYFNAVSEIYALHYGLPLRRSFMGGICVLICAAGFLFGISGLVAEIRRKNYEGRITCVLCAFISFICIGLCLPPIGAASENTRRISCASNIKQIQLALKQYAADYSGNFPPANGAAGLEYLRKYDYLTDYAVYICPSSLTTKGKGNQPLTEDNVDYVYIGGLNEKSDPNSIILYDKASNHEFFGNVAKSGGVIEGIYGKPWTEKIKSER